MPQMAPACWICLFAFISVSLVLVFLCLNFFMIFSPDHKFSSFTYKQATNDIKSVYYFWP